MALLELSWAADLDPTLQGQGRCDVFPPLPQRVASLQLEMLPEERSIRHALNSNFLEC